jgi:hypothetical protein
MKEDEKIVMFDSDEAASRQSVMGWVSRGGFFHGDCGGSEAAARYAGCTHKSCPDCGAVIRKDEMACGPCKERRRRKRYEGLEKREWDGVTPIAIYLSDAYFWEEQELVDHCYDEQVDPAEMLLVLCEPIPARKLDAAEWLEGCMPDDVLEAAQAFNEAVEAAMPLSWRPTAVAAVLPAEILASIAERKRE